LNIKSICTHFDGALEILDLIKYGKSVEAIKFRVDRKNVKKKNNVK